MIKKSLFLLIAALLCAGNPLQAATNSYNETPFTASRWRDYDRRSYFGLRFGLNAPTLRFKGTGGTAQTSAMPRFHLGFVYGNKLGYELPFFIETGLLYTEKGAEIDENSEVRKKVSNLKYFEIPLVLKYKIVLPLNDFSIQPFFGGFFGVGLGGRTKDYGTKTLPEEMSRKKYDSFSDRHFNRLDGGIRLGCGAAYQNFYLELGYDIGLTDIAGSKYTDYHYDDFDGHIRTGNFHLSIGVNF